MERPAAPPLGDGGGTSISLGGKQPIVGADSPHIRSFSSVLISGKQPTVQVEDFPLPPRQYGGKEGCPMVIFSQIEWRSAAARFENSVVAKFAQGRPRIEDFREHIRSKWGLDGVPNLRLLDPRHILVHMESSADVVKALTVQSHQIGTCLFRLFRWNSNFDVKKESTLKAIWVRLPFLPVHCVIPGMIKCIVGSIGRFLRIDERTLINSTCSYVRVCIEVDLLNTLPDRIWIGQSKDEGFFQSVEYEGSLKYCSKCHLQGHVHSECRKGRKEEAVAANVQQTGGRKSGRKSEQVAGAAASKNLDGSAAEPPIDLATDAGDGVSSQRQGADADAFFRAQPGPSFGSGGQTGSDVGRVCGESSYDKCGLEAMGQDVIRESEVGPDGLKAKSKLINKSKLTAHGSAELAKVIGLVEVGSNKGGPHILGCGSGGPLDSELGRVEDDPGRACKDWGRVVDMVRFEFQLGQVVGSPILGQDNGLIEVGQDGGLTEVGQTISGLNKLGQDNCGLNEVGQVKCGLNDLGQRLGQDVGGLKIEDGLRSKLKLKSKLIQDESILQQPVALEVGNSSVLLGSSSGKDHLRHNTSHNSLEGTTLSPLQLFEKRLQSLWEKDPLEPISFAIEGGEQFCTLSPHDRSKPVTSPKQLLTMMSSPNIKQVIEDLNKVAQNYGKVLVMGPEFDNFSFPIESTPLAQFRPNELEVPEVHSADSLGFEKVKSKRTRKREKKKKTEEQRVAKARSRVKPTLVFPRDKLTCSINRHAFSDFEASEYETDYLAFGI